MRQPQKAQKRKTRAELNEEGRERKRQKKHRGRSPGSRANPVDQSSQSGKTASLHDPRIGSKKPIPLTVEPTATAKPKADKQPPAVKPKLSPEQELEQLENDERLDALLERLENGETISKAEHQYVDEKLDRIDELMALLGIELEDEPEDDELLQTRQPDIMQLLKRKD